MALLKRGKYTKINSDMLLEYIRQFPILYDKSLPNYKNPQLKSITWHMVGQRFGISGALAASKWKQLKKKYMSIRACIARERKNGGNSPYETTNKWPTFNLIESILEDCDHERSKSVNNPDSDDTVEIVADARSNDEGISSESQQEADLVLQVCEEYDDTHALVPETVRSPAQHVTQSVKSLSSGVRLVRNYPDFSSFDAHPRKPLSRTVPSKMVHTFSGHSNTNAPIESFAESKKCRVTSLQHEHYYFAMDIATRLSNLDARSVIIAKQQISNSLSELELMQLDSGQ